MQYIKRLILICLFGFGIGNLWAINIGSFTMVKGNVELLRGHKALKVFTSFKIDDKDIISTSKNALAKLMFKDKTVITLGEKSTFKVEDYFFDNSKKSKSTFKVTKGFFRVVTGAIGKVARERFQLKTRNATIGIRGTVFEGTTSAQGDYISCLEHAIVVCASGTCEDVKAGQYTYVAAGTAPQKAQIQKKSAQKQIKKSVPKSSHTEVQINNVQTSARIDSVTQQNEDYNQANQSTEVNNEIDTQKDEARSLAIEYMQIAQEAQVNAQEAAQVAIEAANNANEAFDRILTAKENVTAYELSAYEAAQAAADSAASAAASAAREAAAATAAASAAAAAQVAQTSADSLHQLKEEVVTISSQASQELDIAQNQANIAQEKLSETSREAASASQSAQNAQSEDVLNAIILEKDNAKIHSDLAVSFATEVSNAKDVAQNAAINVENFRDQAIAIENEAQTKLTDAQNAQTEAASAATQAQTDADAAAAARAAAAAAVVDLGDPYKPDSSYTPY